mmetsp:Transcript_24387/g.77251  ORF Transcript_24387/g.77251 Transcript_24387/m.77251 type:complete len:210 (-) Transcript_24387:52-681(-)
MCADECQNVICPSASPNLCSLSSHEPSSGRFRSHSSQSSDTSPSSSSGPFAIATMPASSGDGSRSPFAYETLATQHACARPLEMAVAMSSGEVTKAVAGRIEPSGSVTVMGGLATDSRSAACLATTASSTSLRLFTHAGSGAGEKSPPMRTPASVTLPLELATARPPSFRPCVLGEGAEASPAHSMLGGADMGKFELLCRTDRARGGVR